MGELGFLLRGLVLGFSVAAPTGFGVVALAGLIGAGT